MISPLYSLKKVHNILTLIHKARWGNGMFVLHLLVLCYVYCLIFNQQNDLLENYLFVSFVFFFSFTESHKVKSQLMATLIVIGQTNCLDRKLHQVLISMARKVGIF